MADSPKYLIHSAFRTNGVVERNDVVGAVFGQTEGLLGDELDLRDLQESSRIGRIDVSLDTEAGRTYGTMTIGSRLDRVETAILAAALEAVERIGPSRAEIKIERIEDARAAKRREIVERATELLADLEAEARSSTDLVAEVREEVRVADLTEYEGLPAGPRVADSDAIVIVEGRADVLQLLRFGVKNAIAAEGTDVPDVLSDLTRDRTTTAFLDGDRGGELIFRELMQVAAMDYVSFAPEGTAVEDLDRAGVQTGLRRKAPVRSVADASSPLSAFHGEPPASPATTEAGGEQQVAEEGRGPARADGAVAAPDSSRERATDTTEPRPEGAADSPSVGGGQEAGGTTTAPDAAAGEEANEAAAASTPSSVTDSAPATLGEHVEAVIEAGSDSVRFLDTDFEDIGDAEAADVVDALDAVSPVPATVVLDGPLDQAVLDVAAQRGVEQVVGREAGDVVKRPTAVRIRTAEEF